MDEVTCPQSSSTNLAKFTVAAIPVVVLSDSTEATVVDLCYRSGANSYISKPNHWDELVSLVAKLVSYWSTITLPDIPSEPRLH